MDAALIEGIRMLVLGVTSNGTHVAVEVEQACAGLMKSA